MSLCAQFVMESITQATTRNFTKIDSACTYIFLLKVA